MALQLQRLQPVKIAEGELVPEQKYEARPAVAGFNKQVILNFGKA